PHLAPEGARALWDTADAIWTALGDTATGGTFVSKRATLAAVWAATLLYWLGDESPGAEATAAFIDRRIADVMRLEEAKGALRRNPLTRPLAALPDWILARIPAPAGRPAGPPSGTPPETPAGRP
ncbi:MAG: COQ9 family protein, partial [Rhodobacteraceae bacterium]|nr:COQ9 family protein [Paracoccaceae bacterium]